MDRIETIVIGAGVIGLAVARALAMSGREVLILESEAAIGTGTSSRNSEVIHAGIYYPKGSRKARACVTGRDLLYAYCDSRGVPYKRCGKLIVATDDAQIAKLSAIQEKAAANGVSDLKILSADAAKALEPALSCTGALLSPSTGIIDTHALMLALLGDAENAGAVLALSSPFQSAHKTATGFHVTTGGDHPMELEATEIVNAAGLFAQSVAKRIDGMPDAHIPPQYLAKGNYFTLTRPAPFSRLIYPVPEQGGLGVHLTLDMGGQARFGPDVEWLPPPDPANPAPSLDYRVDAARGDKFYAAIRRYWPNLPDATLQAAYAGIRPKLVPIGAADADFTLSGPRDHGVAGLLHFFGVESPGITSSLALAEEGLNILSTGL
jgi:L-2-hydroxyglutarate oxidase LhgO